jgi:S1-C subfamily serine protease
MQKNLLFTVLIIFTLSVGFSLGQYGNPQDLIADDLVLDEQEMTVRAIQKVIPAVASIIVYDNEEVLSIDLNTGKQTIVNEKQEKGSGTGFIISANGLILTNKHVVEAVSEENGSYRIILNNSKQYYAQLIDKDPINDLAVLKIYDNNLPYVELGDSDKINQGTTVVAIGNALGMYQNSVTKGIVSGLGRNLVASDSNGNTENLDNIIQTDAEINKGNSGGPLIDLRGLVVGINVAMNSAGSSIGFAIPVNDARLVIESVKKYGQIKRPRLGVRYVMVTPEMYYDNNLSRQDGALITKGENGEDAIAKDSAADVAGLVEGDIIFEINAIKIEGSKSLLSVVQRYKPGDRIGLKVQRGDKVLIKTLTLEEYK